jgi:hypothetical protein
VNGEFNVAFGRRCIHGRSLDSLIGCGGDVCDVVGFVGSGRATREEQRAKESSLGENKKESTNTYE